MISFESNGHRFNFRVAAIIEHDGAILFHTTQQDDFWALPGGRVETGEETSAALCRELMEEIGATIAVGELAAIAENFFVWADQPCHEIGFYYRASLTNSGPCLAGAGPYEGLEGESKLTFDWIELKDLGNTLIEPTFLRSILLEPYDGPRHIVHRDIHAL